MRLGLPNGTEGAVGVKLNTQKKQRIAFIRPSAWPLANRIVDGVLKQQFPEYRLDIFDMSQLIRARPDILLRNSLETFALYGSEIGKGKKNFRLSFWRTPYIFQQIKELVESHISPHDYYFSFQMQSLFDASRSGLPHFVYTDHTHLENLHYTANGKDTLYSERWIALERTIYQNATLNFVRSSNVQRSMLLDYDCAADKVKLVYAGSNALINSQKTENANYAHPHILFVGYDWKRKGGPDLVEAFRLVLESVPSAHLTIVGAQPNLRISNCDVIGSGQPDDLDRYYQRASVFCMPTYREPFGIAFIEAMAARLPIVATRVGAIPDFVEEGRNGWLVEPGDIHGIAEALTSLLKNPAMAREFGEKSYQIMRERYSWDIVGKRLQEHICPVLNGNQRGRSAGGELFNAHSACK
jgi:glycosyltransferase involved in cell wall biosynthesis